MRVHLATRGNGATGYSPIDVLTPWTCYKCNTTSRINVLKLDEECPFCGNPVRRFNNGNIDQRRSSGGGKKQRKQFDVWNDK
jgi:hypothetical protein